MSLRACSRCRRHFRAESACPFCGESAESAPVRNAAPSKLSRAAIFAALAGCYTSSPAPEGPPPPPPPHEDHEQRQFADPPRPTGRGTISGTIRDSSNKTPMANIPVTLQSASQPSMELRHTTTDANGRYVFALVPAGGYYVFWGHPHPRSGRPQRTVDLAAGEAETVDLQIYQPPPSNIPMPYGAPPAKRRTV